MSKLSIEERITRTVARAKPRICFWWCVFSCGSSTFAWYTDEDIFNGSNTILDIYGNQLIFLQLCPRRHSFCLPVGVRVCCICATSYGSSAVECDFMSHQNGALRTAHVPPQPLTKGINMDMFHGAKITNRLESNVRRTKRIVGYNIACRESTVVLLRICVFIQVCHIDFAILRRSKCVPNWRASPKRILPDL